MDEEDGSIFVHWKQRVVLDPERIEDWNPGERPHAFPKVTAPQHMDFP